MKFEEKLVGTLYIGIMVPPLADWVAEDDYVSSVENNMHMLLKACNLRVESTSFVLPTNEINYRVSGEELQRQRMVTMRVLDRFQQRKDEEERRHIEQINNSAKSAYVRK
jgi:sorbitol-specific phosphotransferase system component IIBC